MLKNNDVFNLIEAGLATEKVEGNLISVKVPEGASDFRIFAETRPYCVWLEMKGRSMPMPIGNIIHPYRHDELKIIGTKKEATGNWLILEVITQKETV